MDFNPQINFTNNTNQTQSTNLIEQYKNLQTKQVEEKDTIVLSRDFIADLKHNKEKASIGTFVEGHINNKPAFLKVVSNHQGETWFEGVVNKKYLLLHCQDKVYDGKYGDSEFNLIVDYNEPSKLSKFFNMKLLGKNFMPDYFHVKGSIGNKAIDITLPNVKIPQDPETRDLLTMILEDNGLKAQTINGEVKSLKFASSAIKNLKEKAEKREKMIDNDIKPIFMQGISTATGLIIGSVVSALLFKFGLKH